MNKSIICPECKNVINLENPEVDMVIECPFCGVELEIKSIEDGEIKFIMIEEEK